MIPGHWETERARMVAAWAEMSGTEVSVVAGWKTAMERMKAEQQRLKESGAWGRRGPVDVMTIAGFGRREVAHTAVVGWLLGTAREHGLGTAFLDAVLAEIGLPAVPTDRRESVWVTTEETREGRRADIVVRSPGCFLVIEAKVDAWESERQCDDLHRLFKGEANATFVFLTPTGVRPRTATGEAAEAFRPLSFHRIYEMLKAVAGKEPAPAVRTYMDTLEHQFVRRPDMEMDARLRFYFENKKMLDEWAALGSEAKVRANEFFRTVAEPLKARAGTLGEDVGVYALMESNYPKVIVARKGWLDREGFLRAGIGLEWSKGGVTFETSYSGVWVNRTEMATSTPLHMAMCGVIDRRQLAKQGRSAWWPMWRYEPTPQGEWWKDLDGFRTELVDRIVARWETLAPCVDEAMREVG